MTEKITSYLSLYDALNSSSEDLTEKSKNKLTNAYEQHFTNPV